MNQVNFGCEAKSSSWQLLNVFLRSEAQAQRSDRLCDGFRVDVRSVPKVAAQFSLGDQLAAMLKQQAQNGKFDPGKLDALFAANQGSIGLQPKSAKRVRRLASPRRLLSKIFHRDQRFSALLHLRTLGNSARKFAHSPDGQAGDRFCWSVRGKTSRQIRNKLVNAAYRRRPQRAGARMPVKRTVLPPRWTKTEALQKTESETLALFWGKKLKKNKAYPGVSLGAVSIRN
jgi:hypothetical protein